MSKKVFDGPIVDLQDMLEARERRSLRQRSLLEKHAGAAVLSATMNIPGPVKTSQDLGLAFDQIISQIESLISEKKLFSKKLELKTGWEYYLVADMTPMELKRTLIAIEEGTVYGRLMDLDVIQVKDNQVTPISRTQLGLSPRKCYICSAIAKECSRSRKHSVEDMQKAIADILKQS